MTLLFMEMNTSNNSIHIVTQPRWNSCPRSGEAQSALIAMLAWFLLHHKIEHQAMLSLGLDLLSSSFW